MECADDMMRILTVHNYTEGFATGGEAHVFEDESLQLERNGHSVSKLVCSNSEAIEASASEKLVHFVRGPWSKEGYRRMEQAICDARPDVIHVHNFFLILSPSIFRAARHYGIPTVVSLHNYRLIVPCSQLLYAGTICEKCVGKNPWRILVNRCYRGSTLASVLRYRFYYLSQRIHNWWDDIDVFVALTEFGRRKFIEGGLPAERIVVKPNSVEDPLAHANTRYPGHGALYVGTLTPEKGVRQLIEAWREIEYPLTILGDGHLKSELMRNSPAQVCFKGVVSRDEVNRHLAECAFLVMPSICYEGFGLVTVEAMAMGKPVLGSGIGSTASLVSNGKTGLHFTAGDVRDMRLKARTLIADPNMRASLGQQARVDYLARYTPEQNYQNLMAIYTRAIQNKNRSS